MVGVGSGRRLRKWNLVKPWFLPACKGFKWHRMSHNLQFGTFYLFFSWILGNMSSAERVKKNLRLWFTKIKAMSRLWIKVVSQAWKTSSFIVSNLSCPEEKELRVLNWSSSSAIWGSDLVDPLQDDGSCLLLLGGLESSGQAYVGAGWREGSYHQQPGRLSAKLRSFSLYPHLPTEFYSSEIILDIYTLLWILRPCVKLQLWL